MINDPDSSSMEENQPTPKPKTYRLRFGTIEIHDDFIVGVPNKDQNMGKTEARETIEAVGHHFTDTFGYIGNRKNNNSIDPMAYLFVTKELLHFRVMAVVSYSPYGHRFLEIEKKIAKIAQLKFKAFPRLETAISWMKDSLKSI
jgi:hypothetical protein